ncbi:hypothetical protein F5X99DRAFT_384725 [Biscogniauxia marginata]|nr:hypothetical protein F5X99DRAFT_384725 [Biscogniauxia marginata]
MDRIQGAELATEWLKLGWITSIRLAFQLRRTIRRLRTVKSSTADSLVTGQCRSYYLEYTFGLPLRANPNEVNAFLNFLLGEFCLDRSRAQKDISTALDLLETGIFDKSPFRIHSPRLGTSEYHA